jgi:UDP-N-acetylmuramate--alanine ligase
MKLAKAKVHFIGIGGIGMCGLAELLHNMGTKVSGSDLTENAQTLRLRSLGIPVVVGQGAENVHGAEVVVYSSAVKPDNPEFREARNLKIPLIPRAEALAEIMLLKRGVAIGGSHGKTTTTSMTASVFLEAKVDPTIVVGGRLDLIKSTALLGKGEWLVAEADESDGSFLRLHPEVVVITNVDNDHLDYYGSVENLQRAFYEFAMRIPFYGLAILCGDDPTIQKVFGDFPKRSLMYGFGKHNDLRLEGEKSEYSVFRGDVKLGSFKLRLPGRHNALNAVAAFAAGLEAGFSFDVCKRGLEAFAGVDRRFQFKGTANGVEVYDDYGHHPTEIEAVLSAFREKYPDRRIVAAFQPHRYSRTQLCWAQFIKCFDGADCVLITDIYAAGEKPIDGITTENLLKELKHKKASKLAGGEARLPQVLSELKTGDVLVTLGAGDIWKLGQAILDSKVGTSKG